MGVACNELSIKKNLTYNSSSDIIDGLKHLQERSNNLGTHICVFILKGLFSNCKFVLNYFVTAYFDSSADDFVCTNIPIKLTSSRYFVGYIAKESF